MSVKILAIESSCDETSAAVIQDGIVLSNIILSQSIHEIYGGVVPELASRAHQQHIISIVDRALKESKFDIKAMDAIAFTEGPGLLGALLVGISFSKGLALSMDIPLISVNHMQAHILAHFIDDPKPSFPFLCLTVSGGHTQIVKVTNYLDMEVLGETRDDAVGEAFDKTAKMLGLPYPGGHLIDSYAQEGNPSRFKFPRTEIEGCNYSFSGIKTAVLYFLRDEIKKDDNFIKNNLHDLCASIQYSLIDMLLDKLAFCAEKFGIRNIAIAGGVAANSELRKKISNMELTHNWKTFIPKIEYCTDNAAMIAIAAHFKYMNKDFADLSVTPEARLKM